MTAAALRTLSPVLRGEGRVRGQRVEIWRRSQIDAFVPSPQPSPLSTGERENARSMFRVLARQRTKKVSPQTDFLETSGRSVRGQGFDTARLSASENRNGLSFQTPA